MECMKLMRCLLFIQSGPTWRPQAHGHQYSDSLTLQPTLSSFCWAQTLASQCLLSHTTAPNICFSSAVNVSSGSGNTPAIQYSCKAFVTRKAYDHVPSLCSVSSVETSSRAVVTATVSSLIEAVARSVPAHGNRTKEVLSKILSKKKHAFGGGAWSCTVFRLQNKFNVIWCE